MNTQGRPDGLDRATQDIRDEYAQRAKRAVAKHPRVIWSSRIALYGQMWKAVGLGNLRGRRFLDVGCANGGWLELCGREWGLDPRDAVGVDLREDLLEKWRQDHPDSAIRLYCRPAHELDFEPGWFDIVHHSMMLSSIVDATLRQHVAAAMWNLLKPGGWLVSFDFWINPTNRKTVGIRRSTLRHLFPEGRMAFAQTTNLAPPVARLLSPLGDTALLFLQRLRFLNTHDLVVLKKPT